MTNLDRTETTPWGAIGRTVVAALACFAAATASAATVTLNHPSQGETVAGGTVNVSVSLSQDFQAGRDGWIEIWVDGARVGSLKSTNGQVNVAPGNHQLQARLVDLNHRALRVPTASEQITFTVPTVDPHGP